MKISDTSRQDLRDILAEIITDKWKSLREILDDGIDLVSPAEQEYINKHVTEMQNCVEHLVHRLKERAHPIRSSSK